MPQTTWTIHERTDTFTADALTADWPTVTRGETVTLRFWFDSDNTDDTLLVEDGESYTVGAGDTETYQRVIVEDGGTLTVNGTLNATEDGLFRLLQYLDWAGAVATGQGENHVPWYRDQLPGGYVPTLALGFEPHGDLQERSVTGLWGVVVGGSDERNAPLTNWQVELDVFVLAEFREYSDHSAVEAALSV